MIIKLFILIAVVVVLLLLLKELRLISSTRVFFMRPHDICGRSAKRHHLNGLSVCLSSPLSVSLPACLSFSLCLLICFYFLPGGRLKIILTKQKKDKWNFSRCFNILFHTQGSFVVGCVGNLEWGNLRLLKVKHIFNVMPGIHSVWTEPKRCWVVRKTSWMNLLLILFAIKHWKLSES